MTDFFVSMGNAVVDRSPDELIAAVIIALAVSLAMAGIYCIGRRSLRENLMPMIVLMLVANMVSMAVGAGYLARVKKKPGSMLHSLRHGGPVGPETTLSEAIFRAADLNRDGRLSGEEASLAAGQFVRQADRSGKGSIDLLSLDQAILSHEFRGRALSRARDDTVDRAPRWRSASAAFGPPAEDLPALGRQQRERGPDTKQRNSRSN